MNRGDELSCNYSVTPEFMEDHLNKDWRVIGLYSNSFTRKMKIRL